MRFFTIITAPIRLPIRACIIIIKNVPNFFRGTKQKFKVLAVDAIPLVTAITSVVTLRYWMAQEKEKFNTSDEIFQAIGGQFVMGSLTGPGLSRVGRSISSQFLPAKMINPYLRKGVEFKAKFAQMYHFLPPSHRNAIEQCLIKWDSYIEDNFLGMLDALEKKLLVLTALPYKKAPEISPEKFNLEIMPAVETLIKNYTEEFKDQIREFIKSIVRNINQEENFDEIQQGLRVQPLFIVGPPGVGKSTLVEALAKILKIGFFRHKVSPTQSQEDIEGSNNMWENNLKPGLILEALMSAEKTQHSTSCILLLDELDKCFPKQKHKETPIAGFLKGWMLDVFNEQTNLIKHKAYEAEFGITNVYVVVAANRDFVQDFSSQDDIDAFVTRRQLLHIKPLENKAKHDIGMQYYDKLIETIINASKSTSKKSSNTSQKVQVFFNESHREFVKKIIEFDKFPGVRVMLHVIKAYVDHVKDAAFFKEFGKKEFNIVDKYKLYQQIEGVNIEEPEKDNKENQDKTKDKTPDIKNILETSVISLEKKGSLEQGTIAASALSSSTAAPSSNNLVAAIPVQEKQAPNLCESTNPNFLPLKEGLEKSLQQESNANNGIIANIVPTPQSEVITFVWQI